jgi:hypothetical protein
MLNKTVSPDSLPFLDDVPNKFRNETKSNKTKPNETKCNVVSLDFVSIGFVSFHLISFRFVSHFTGTGKLKFELDLYFMIPKFEIRSQVIQNVSGNHWGQTEGWTDTYTSNQTKCIT